MREENSELKRWEKAQVYEKNWWKTNATRVGINYYETSAEEIRKYFNTNSKLGLNNDTKILEIGSGAVGILTFLTESNFRFGIDPLEYYYATIPEFKKARDEKVKYSSDKGEELPFENNYFDLIIMDNVLDHCQSPDLVFSEMDRVLSVGGVVYFRQNTYNYYGKYFRNFMELFQIDKGHPYSFSKTELKNKFSSYNLKIIATYSVGYFSTWKKEITSKSFKDIVKALLLVTRNKVTFVLKKLT
jgi:ubiquinone/menaquinone biosynthesis C-methylase UbiE